MTLNDDYFLLILGGDGAPGDDAHAGGSGYAMPVEQCQVCAPAQPGQPGRLVNF